MSGPVVQIYLQWKNKKRTYMDRGCEYPCHMKFHCSSPQSWLSSALSSFLYVPRFNLQLVLVNGLHNSFLEQSFQVLHSVISLPMKVIVIITILLEVATDKYHLYLHHHLYLKPLRLGLKCKYPSPMLPPQYFFIFAFSDYIWERTCMVQRLSVSLYNLPAMPSPTGVLIFPSTEQYTT